MTIDPKPDTPSGLASASGSASASGPASAPGPASAAGAATPPVPKPLLLDLPGLIATPRLILRPPRPGDGPFVNEAVLESLAELAPWMPWASPAPSVEDSEEFARRGHAAFASRRELNWLCILKETHELAGICGIHTIDWGVPRGEIGYWVRTRLAGRGLVHEAVEALTALGFGTLGLARIEIRCDQGNDRSARVARAAGYPLEGVLRRQARGVGGELRDTLLFARVAGDPPPPPRNPGTTPPEVAATPAGTARASGTTQASGAAPAHPAAPAVQAYTIGPPLREDLPAIRDLGVAVDVADGTERASTLSHLEEGFEDTWSDPRTDAFVARSADGEVAAWGRTFLSPAPEKEARVHVLADVHPEHRDRGIFEEFFARVEARGRERADAAPAGLRRYLMVPIDSRDEARKAFLEARGYHFERAFFRMLRDLREPIPEPGLPEGLTVSPWRPERDSAYHALFNETFGDHWGFDPVEADDWRQFFSEASTFRPDLARGIFDGDELVAFSMNYTDPEENERVGRRQAWIGQLGVRRAWRKRGLATVLLGESMRAFRSAGFEWAILGVDAESLTGAVGVYEKAGFRSFLTTAVYTLAW